MIVDFHSHILPCMDDGAKDIKMSIEMLKIQKQHGVDIVVATPHFYRQDENISSFLKRREESYRMLTEATQGMRLPEILLGAEVLFTPSLADEDLQKLCIEGTNYMLLELPYQRFTQQLMNSLRDFESTVEVKLIMAHVERYYNFTDENSLLEMITMGMVNQINCDSFLHMGKIRNKLIHLIDENYVHVLGTDTHNCSTRPPNLEKAYSYISKKLPTNRLMKNAKRLLENRDILY